MFLEHVNMSVSNVDQTIDFYQRVLGFPSGYRANSFKFGDEITVTVQPAANGQPYGRLSQAVLADGTTVGGRGAAAP